MEGTEYSHISVALFIMLYKVAETILPVDKKILKGDHLNENY